MANEFQPTYLYIKQHSVTGKLYFGKTTKSIEGMLKYKGSGKHWVRHIKMHGMENVVTLWYERFDIEMELTEFAEMFSKEMNIVESNSWLNLKAENGLDGGSHGSPSEETRRKLSNAGKNRVLSEETRDRIAKGNTGKTCSSEHREKISASKTGQRHSDDVRKRISDSNKGKHSGKRKPLSEETKKKLAEAMKGKKMPFKPWSEARRLAQQRKKTNAG